MNVDLLSVKTEDGLRLDGVLHRAIENEHSVRPATAILCLHGVGGNFYASRLQQQLTPGLLESFAAVLWVNTRGRDGFYTGSVRGQARRLGAAYEIVDDARFDLNAWVAQAKELGYERVGLWGHSLGAVKALYHAAQAPLQPADFVIAASPPRLSYRAYMAAGSPEFSVDMRRAQRMQTEGRGQELIEATFPTPLLISADTYVDKYGPGERYNLLDSIGSSQCPMLVTYGQKELVSGSPAFAGMPEALQKSAAPDAQLEVAAIAGANHFYSGTSDLLSEAMAKWIDATL